MESLLTKVGATWLGKAGTGRPEVETDGTVNPFERVVTGWTGANPAGNDWKAGKLWTGAGWGTTFGATNCLPTLPTTAGPKVAGAKAFGPKALEAKPFEAKAGTAENWG